MIDVRLNKRVEVVKGQALRLARFLAYVARRFNHDGALTTASALSYTTLLSLVPLIAVALAMLAAFPVFDVARADLQAWIFQNFVPAVGEVVQRNIARFVEKAGQLTAAGIVGLAVTAIMLLVTIEGALNRIFRVAKDRAPVSRLLVYWTSLTLGPLLLGASFSLSGYFTAVESWAVQWGLRGALATVTRWLPNLLLVVTFALLYFAVPNRRVRLADALWGGLLAGLMFAALRWGFGYYVASAKVYQSVYGALSTLPIFLVWMYLSWLVILLGAELTAALPEWRAGRRDVATTAPHRRRLGLGLQVLEMLFEHAQTGKPVRRKDLLARTAAEERALMSVMDRLLRHDFCARTSNGGYVLTRDLASTTLYDFIQALDLGIGPDDADGLSARWSSLVKDNILAADRGEHAALDLNLRELILKAVERAA